MNGFLVMLILKLNRVSVRSAKALTGISQDEQRKPHDPLPSMDVLAKLTKLKEKAEERTVSAVLALIVLLLLIVWRAVPSEVWDRVSEATPKRVLWALLGLVAITATLEWAYIVGLRRKNKLKPRFGVYWDRGLTPYCPACSKVLAYIHKPNAGGLSGTWGFKCVQCPSFIPLNDDSGQSIEITEARRLLSGDKIAAPELDETSMQILNLLAAPNSQLTAEDLATILHLHPQRMTHFLSNLTKQKYIYRSGSFGIPSGPTTYHLNEKGRVLLVSKNLI